MEAAQMQAQGAVLGGNPQTPPTYREAVYTALERAKAAVARLENLKLIVDATPALGQLPEHDVSYLSYL